MGTDVNTCLCYESNPSGSSSARSGVSSTTSSSSASIRLCAAECGAEILHDAFQGTTSDGYDGTVEVLGWSCFTTVPANIPAESISSLPEATNANTKSQTSASAVVAAAVTTATGGLPGVHLHLLHNATVFSYNTTYAYGAPRYVMHSNSGSSGSITLMLGGVYVFTPLTKEEGADHPLRLSSYPDGTHYDGGTMYKDIKTVHMGVDNTTVVLVATCEVPTTLYYYSPNRKGMGGVMSLSRP